MQAATISSPPANENAQGLRLNLYITDPEVAQELERRGEGPERDAFAKQALRIGVLALRQANGALDAQTIQREGERMLSSVREALAAHTATATGELGQLLARYLDPASGSLPQRLERLTKRDGEIDAVLAKHLDGDRSTVAQTLVRHVGEQSAIFKLLSPTQADGLVAALSSAVDEALRTQRDEVVEQFSLDRPDSALSRLVAEVGASNGKLRGDVAEEVGALTKQLSLDNEAGPLGRFVSRVERAQKAVLDQFSLDAEGSAMRRLSSTLDKTAATVKSSLTLDDKASPLSRLREELMAAVASFGESNARFQSDVRATLESMRARRAEAARSSSHGHSFEYAAGDMLQTEAQRVGDVCERVAGTPGREGRKVGDYVLTMGPESGAPGVRIVVECKSDKKYSEALALGEIALGRKNRDAQFGIFLVDRASAKVNEASDEAAGRFEPLRRVGSDVLVIWDADDPATDVYVKAALSIARALVVRQHAELGRAETDVREIEQSVRGIERMVTAVESVAHDAQLVVKRGTKIGKTAQGMRERLGEEVERLMGVVEGMRDGDREHQS